MSVTLHKPFVRTAECQKMIMLESFKTSQKNLKKDLYVKLHPRSNVSLYSAVEENGGKLGYQYPTASMYIGHYSSLFCLSLKF